MNSQQKMTKRAMISIARNFLATQAMPEGRTFTKEMDKAIRLGWGFGGTTGDGMFLISPSGAVGFFPWSGGCGVSTN